MNKGEVNGTEGNGEQGNRIKLNRTEVNAEQVNGKQVPGTKINGTEINGTELHVCFYTFYLFLNIKTILYFKNLFLLLKIKLALTHTTCEKKN